MGMKLDVSLPLALSLITTATFLLYTRYGEKIRSLFGGKEFSPRDAALLVAMIGMAVTIIAFIPEMAILVFFLGVYSSALFLFAYLVAPKWYLAILAPASFIVLYLFHWNIYFLDLFATLFAISISMYLGSLFTWKTTAAFVALITIMDIVQVFYTKLMVVSGEKLLQLGFPTVIVVPTFPSDGRITLGLGDVFLFGLLVIQTTQKYGRRSGLTAIVAMTATFLLLETILLNFVVGCFPATVFVACGWLAALGAIHLYKAGASKG